MADWIAFFRMGVKRSTTFLSPERAVIVVEPSFSGVTRPVSVTRTTPGSATS